MTETFLLLLVSYLVEWSGANPNPFWISKFPSCDEIIAPKTLKFIPFLCVMHEILQMAKQNPLFRYHDVKEYKGQMHASFSIEIIDKNLRFFALYILILSVPRRIPKIDQVIDHLRWFIWLSWYFSFLMTCICWTIKVRNKTSYQPVSILLTQIRNSEICQTCSTQWGIIVALWAPCWQNYG